MSTTRDLGNVKGPQGDAATIAVGSVTTGEPGTPAAVQNSGTQQAAVFDFTIPKGPQGNAATIAVGVVTTGEPGTAAVVENTGTQQAAVFNFTIPRGNVGQTGAPGTASIVDDTTQLVYKIGINNGQPYFEEV